LEKVNEERHKGKKIREINVGQNQFTNMLAGISLMFSAEGHLVFAGGQNYLN